MHFAENKDEMRGIKDTSFQKTAHERLFVVYVRSMEKTCVVKKCFKGMVLLELLIFVPVALIRV